MYARIFQSIYDGTLVEDWRALVTFQQMLVLCDADGVVDMTPRAISRRTGIPIEHIEAGIHVLESPDPTSRTETEEGRRILRIDPHRAWGWRLVNYKKYKEIRNEEDRREYMRKYMADRRKDEKLTTVNSKPELAKLANIDVNEDVDVNESKPIVASVADDAPTSKPRDDCPHQAIVALYHEVLPACPRVKTWDKDRAAYLRSRWREDPKRQNLDWWRKFFEFVRDQCPFLLGEGASRGGAPPFLADLEWLIRPQNFRKVIEGRYDKTRAKA